MWPSKKLKEVAGEVDESLLRDGDVAPAIVTGVDPDGALLTVAGEQHRVCRFTLEVAPEGDHPYVVTIRQRVPERSVPALVGRRVSVRVDRGDPARVAIVLGDR